VHHELRGKGVTLALLWHEYKVIHPGGLQYSQFCERYRAWAATLDIVMRQQHRAGEKLFVDYAGHTVQVLDRSTGELRQAQVFIATLGASSYTYAEATWTQTLADWTASHVRAFSFFGGVPELVIPDNLRSAVSRACRYDPVTNPTYHDLATHYDVAVLPTRVRRPRDKAKVEVAVQVVERWILAALRHHQFFSLAELNAHIAQLLTRLNARAFRKLPGSRRSAFEQLDAPALRPLPSTPYVFSQWKKVRVHLDHHVEFDGHYYSVPYALVKRQLDLRYTAETIEVMHRGERVSSHVRSSMKGAHSTHHEHMPKGHQQMGQWTPERLVNWAESIGPATATLMATVIRERAHPQQAYRACLGILRLSKTYGDARLDKACQRALTLGTHRYRSIASILAKRLDERPIANAIDSSEVLIHDNIRGADYYH
jgi:transposase